jgi:hypothetical protein
MSVSNLCRVRSLRPLRSVVAEDTKVEFLENESVVKTLVGDRDPRHYGDLALYYLSLYCAA